MKERYWQLDFWRAIAIISVFFYHNLILPADNYFLLIANKIITILWSGVDLFFVLSGFLITSILFDSSPGKKAYLRFLSRRALRIFPLYFFWLIIYYLILINLFAISNFEDLWSSLPYFMTYTLNFYLLKTQAWPEPGHLNHLWSLAVEEQFYLIWPLVFFLVQKKRLIYILLAGILTAHTIKLFMYINDYPWNVIYTQLYTRMDAILCGGLAAWLWKYKRGSRLLVVLSAICAITSFIYILAVMNWQQTGQLNNHTVTFLSIGLCWFFASMILLSLYIENEKIRIIFHNSFFRIIATLSYGIYISHLIIMNLVTEMMIRLDMSNIIIEFFLNLVLTLTVSYGLYRIVELPFLNYKNRLKYEKS